MPAVQYVVLRCIVSVVFGAIIGAYTNTLAYRIHTDIGILANSCFCPRCSQKINLFDQIPIVSYLLLRGKSKCCGETIDSLYFWVELGTALWYMIISVVFDVHFFLSLLLSSMWIFACLIVWGKRIAAKIRWKKAIGGGIVLCIYQFFYGICIAVLYLTR